MHLLVSLQRLATLVNLLGYHFIFRGVCALPLVVRGRPAEVELSLGFGERGARAPGVLSKRPSPHFRPLPPALAGRLGPVAMTTGRGGGGDRRCCGEMEASGGGGGGFEMGMGAGIGAGGAGVSSPPDPLRSPEPGPLAASRGCLGLSVPGVSLSPPASLSGSPPLLLPLPVGLRAPCAA